MKRKILGAILAAAAVIALSACTKTEPKESPATPPYYMTTQEQLDYQYELDRSENRVSSSYPSFNVADGRLYQAVSKNGSASACHRSCAVAVKHDDGWEVKLPVGFTYRLDGGDPGMTRHEEDFNAERIMSLTYWDPEAHELRTVVAEDDGSIQAPEVLRYRQVKDLEVGQYGFIGMHDIVELADGKVAVVSFGEMSLEPGDYSFETDQDMMIPITLREDGIIIVCLGRPPVLYLPDTILEDDGIAAEMKDC